MGKQKIKTAKKSPARVRSVASGKKTKKTMSRSASRPGPVKKKSIKKVAKKPAKPAKKPVKPVQKKTIVPKLKQVSNPLKTIARTTKSVMIKPVAKPAVVPVATPSVPPTMQPMRGKRSGSSKKPLLPPPPPPPPLKKVITIVKSEGDRKKPEPPGKYTFEYIIHSPIAIIFEMISTPSGLSEWFADDVNVKEGAFVFFWDGIPNMAKLVNYKDDRLVRFQWEGRNDGKYFEFRLQTDELTNEVSLFVTDFLEEGADLPSARLLWDKQISNLKHILGS